MSVSWNLGCLKLELHVLVERDWDGLGRGCCVGAIRRHLRAHDALRMGCPGRDLVRPCGDEAPCCGNRVGYSLRCLCI